jgi:branched-subunit amino acid transport protein
MKASTLGLILAAMAATFIPRFLPFLLTKARFPAWLERYLRLVPAAALGALILPGLLTDYSQAPLIGLLGVLGAGVYAYFRGGLIVPVLIAFGVTWAGLTFF